MQVPAPDRAARRWEPERLRLRLFATAGRLAPEFITWGAGELAHLERNADLSRLHRGGWPNWQTAAQTAPGGPRLATTS